MRTPRRADVAVHWAGAAGSTGRRGGANVQIAWVRVCVALLSSAVSPAGSCRQRRPIAMRQLIDIGGLLAVAGLVLSFALFA